MIITGNLDLKTAAGKDGNHSDHKTRGLYLVVKGGSKRWVFRYRVPTHGVTSNGKEKTQIAKEITLGRLADMTLATARMAAGDQIKLRKAGIDDLKGMQVDAQAKVAEPTAAAVTFQQDTEAYFKVNKGSWTEDHAANWMNSMKLHVFPTIGDRATASLTPDDIAGVLETIWDEKNETSVRIHGRIKNVIEMAQFKRRNEFTAINPALGLLKYHLPKGKRPPEVRHPAIPFEDAPALFARLAELDDPAARALRFLMLTCTPRAGEVLGAEWSMIEGNVFHQPARLVKSGKKPPFKGRDIPLTPEALAIIEPLRTGSKFVFTGRTGKKVGGRFIPFSGAMHKDAMQDLLRDEMGLPWHVHGLRATFRTWATKCLNLTFVEDRAVEAALDHTIRGEEVRLKYDRDGLLEERRLIAGRWARYLTAT